MKRILSLALAACATCVFAQSEEDPFAELDWKTGPTTARVGPVASQKVEEGYVFLEDAGTRKFLELNENPSSKSDVGVIAPDDLSWFAVYSWDPIGYVRDNEKESLDGDAILEALRKGSEQNNAERRRRGWEEMTLLGWAREPHYDETTHNLEWATKFSSSHGTVVNYNTRILGRGGVMRAILVCDPEELSDVLPKFKSALKGFGYTAGNRYSEFRAGDHIAEIGLSALIVGGATAAAVKTGAFKWLWKGIVVIAAAIGGLFKKIFGRGKRDQ